MERIKGKKILVTGGAGFIGSHVVMDLLDEGAEIAVVDTSIKPDSFFSLQNLRKKVKFTFLDISNQKKIFSYLKIYKFDYIVHLAAEPIVTEGYKNPLKVFKTNVTGTVNILEAVRTMYPTTGIIVASSDKAYGKTKEAYTEDLPLRGDHPYDVSKSCADLIAQTYYKTYGLPVVITRFGNVYGEGDIHFDRIIPGICRSIIEGNALEIRSDGTYVRDYLYVKDVAGAYIFLLKNLSKIKGEAFNFSSNDTFSVLDLIARVEAILQVKIPYKILKTAKNEIPYQHLDDSKIKKLGWKNKYTIEKKFIDTLNWYRKILVH